MTCLMKAAGDQLLAGPAFTLYIDVGIGDCNLGHLGQYRLHLAASGDDPLKDRWLFRLGRRRALFASRSAFFQAALDLADQFSLLEGFGQITAGAALHGVYRIANGSRGR